MALEAADLVTVNGRVLLAATSLSLEAEGTADALHVHSDRARALSAASEGGDGQARQVTHLAVVALGDRPSQGLAQLVEVEALTSVVAPVLAYSAPERL